MDGQSEPQILHQQLDRLYALLANITDERAVCAIREQIRETKAVLDEVEPVRRQA